MRTDYIITRDGRAITGVVGGNALYSAVGAALWRDEVALWSKIGDNYPAKRLETLAQFGLNVTGLVRVPGQHDHRTFYAYLAGGQRDDTEPEKHFSRIGHTFPAELRGYVHSTPGQSEPDHFEPLALRPADWPSGFVSVDAVHLAPLPLSCHLAVLPELRRRPIRWITVDPGERYMLPHLQNHIRSFLPLVDAFLPSEQEVRSLFGPAIDLEDAAQRLLDWGAPLVVVKRGAKGVMIAAQDMPGLTRLAPYHSPGDEAIVDVTGAGDAFCGGFVVGLIRTGDPLRAGRYGLVSASIVIEGYGATYGLHIPRVTAEERLRTLSGSQFARW